MESKSAEDYFDASISRLLTVLKGIEFKGGTLVKSSFSQNERTQSKYFRFEDKKEKRRYLVKKNRHNTDDSFHYAW